MNNEKMMAVLEMAREHVSLDVAVDLAFIVEEMHCSIKDLVASRQATGELITHLNGEIEKLCHQLEGSMAVNEHQVEMDQLAEQVMAGVIDAIPAVDASLSADGGPRKIDAIKRMREAAPGRLGLRATKSAIEERMNQLGVLPPY